MKQLVLLAGLHKTATTSIQKTCGANIGWLHRAGFSYPEVGFGYEGRKEANHTRLLNALFRHEPHKYGLQSQFVMTKESPRSAVEAGRADFAKTLEPLRRMLLAAEGVSLFSATELQGMKDWLAGIGWETQVFCHVRHLSGWMNSMIAQRVTSAIALSIPQAIDEYVQYGSIVRRRIENLRQVFPDARFYSHEAAIRHPGGPVGAFFENAGIRSGERIRYLRANEGSSEPATRFISLVYERFGRYTPAGEPNPQGYVPQEFLDAVRKIQGHKFRLRPDEAGPLMPMLQADNEWLRQTLGEDFHDPGLAFDDHPCDWTSVALAELKGVLAEVPKPVRQWVVSNQAKLGFQHRIGIQPPLR